MDRDRYRRAGELFAAALPLEGEARRHALAAATADDPELRRLVEQMLGADMTPLPTLERAVLRVADAVLPDAALPERIGSYRIVRRLGGGGMGVVYEALQDKPERRVALKVVQPGVATESLRQRFMVEIEALGRLSHSGIARIYEAGVAPTPWGEQPFLAMEFVEGAPFLEAARARPIEEQVALLAQVCDAVQFAHEHGVLHRDLMPDNLLVTRSADADAGRGNGVAKVLDFGLARLTDTGGPNLTRSGLVMGTLAYASPEQVQGGGVPIDVRSDVYSLGVVAYELLAGRLPYAVDGLPIAEAARVIAQHDPPSPRSFGAPVPVDVELILARALAKEPARRYPTMAELGADLRRWLRREPVQARPSTALYRVSRFARRNAALVGAAAAIFVVLTVSSIVAITWALKAEAETREARRQADIATGMSRFVNEDLILAAAPSKRGKDLRVVDALLAVDDERLRRRFAGKPAVEAAIRFKIGTLLSALSEYEAAERQIQESIRGYEATLGPDHPETLEATNELGIVYIDWGRFDDAANWLARTLEARARVLGPLHRHTLGTKCNLANVWKGQRRYAQAETAYRELIAVLPMALAENDPYRDAIPRNLVSLLNDTGRYEECRLLLMPMLDESRKKLGDDHPGVLTLLTSLAVLQRNTGEVDAAIGTNRTILAVYERTHGRNHATTQISVYNLANSLRTAKRPAEAEPLVREVYERRLADLGRSNLFTASAANLLGTILHDLGRFGDAATS